METFYASITNNLVFKGIKYKIGKRYPLINGKEKFHKWNDIDINNIYGKLSIYLVKIDKTNNYFKILKEINYSKFLKSKDKKENLISALKNRDEWSLSKFSDTSDMSQQVNAYIKNENYLDGLIELNELKYLSRFSVKYLHNKYLNYLIDNDDSSCDNDIILYMANLGISKYLDKILQKDKYNNNFEIRAVLKNGRKKDLKKYIKSDDFLIKNFLAKYGDDEILDTLVAEDFISTREEIINRKRIKDLKFYLTKKDLYADLFIKIITFKIDELLPIILEQRKDKELYSVMIDDTIYESYGDKTLLNLIDTKNEKIIEKILELKNEEYINYILDKGNSIQKNFILDKFHNFDHAKKLIFDKDKKVSEKSFLVLMEDDNRELFREKLNS